VKLSFAIDCKNGNARGGIMYMTVEEARVKRCPFGKLQESGAWCTASDCMAWRWIPEPSPDNVGDLGWCGIAGHPDAMESIGVILDDMRRELSDGLKDKFRRQEGTKS
jgi:hypothetical protein